MDEFEVGGGKDGRYEFVTRGFIDTIVHETLRALYFSDYLYNFFVDESGQQPLEKSQVMEKDSLKRWAIKTPVTVTKGRDHFGCPSLSIVPMEDGGDHCAISLGITRRTTI